MERERGVIPMSDAFHNVRPAKRVVRIGTAGGFVKPSTGYSFSRTQSRLERIVADLERRGEIGTVQTCTRWKMLLDSVMLEVMESGLHPLDDVFTRPFKKNSTQDVLSFLDENTSIRADFRIMSTVPLAPFSKAAFREVLKTLTNS